MCKRSMIGPGKYDKLCSAALAQTQAEAVLIIVLHGNKGSGFSASIVEPYEARVLPNLPGILRSVAEQIEQDAQMTAKQ